MLLPEEVLFIIDRLKSRGYSAHVVGGAVRDSLIGRELGDFDITTDALPEEAKAAFSEYRTIDTGIKHGTVSVIIDKIPYEITTYRIDGDYKDNRHPDSVTFTRSLSEDLKRRDFTVNAMCYNPDDGLVDPFSGAEDAEAKVIRAVGDPCVRFDEDALRILRALRFSSVLDFDIEEATSRAAHNKRELLLGVSSERIYTELHKLIMGVRPSSVMLEYSDVFEVVFDGFKITHMPSDEEMRRAEYLTRLASLFFLNSDFPEESAECILASLKTDKFTRVATVSALRAYKSADFSSENSVLHLLADFGEQTVKSALDLGILLGRFSDRENSLYTSLMARGPVYTIAGLNVRGEDVIALGIRGEAIGERLRELLFAVIDGKCENSKESLIAYLTK